MTVYTIHNHHGRTYPVRDAGRAGELSRAGYRVTATIQ